jgi:hypothetical protein
LTKQHSSKELKEETIMKNNKSREPSPVEEYYDDCDESEQPIAVESRFMKVLGTSYGISLLAHVVLLLLLTMVVFFVPEKQSVVRVMAKHVHKAKRPPEDVPLKKITTPKVTFEERVEKPIIPTEPIEIPSERPKGKSDAHSDKNLDNDSFSDAMGVGGGGANAFGLPDGFGRRADPGGCGVSVVDAALLWLKNHQSRDGSWEAHGWQRNCKKGRCSGPGQNKGNHRFDAGVSSLAILAFLGRGYTHRFGPYKRIVGKAFHWLKRQQKSDGSIGFQEGEEIYNHAIATMALCEAFAMTRDSRLKRSAQRAVDFCVRAQNPGQGWRYGVKPGNNDTSVTGWMVLALKAAKTARLDVPEAAFEGAQNWFKRATDSRGDAGYISAGGGSSYVPVQKGKFDQTPCMTAVSVVCRIFAGEKRTHPDIRKGAALLLRSLPKRQSKHRATNFYYWYYASYALFQTSDRKFDKWKEPLFKTVMSYAREKGCERGSFDPVSEWSVAGGRVYATAINALTLEVLYRYERVKQ